MKLHCKTKVSLISITRVLALLQFLHMLDLACEKRLFTRNVFLFIYLHGVGGSREIGHLV